MYCIVGLVHTSAEDILYKFRKLSGDVDEAFLLNIDCTFF